MAAPVEVGGLPAGAAFVPVSAAVDFSAWLADRGVAGTVDERTVRLFRLSGPDGEVEEPVQFDSDPQPRPTTRALLPGTPTAVSYAAEHPAGVTPEGVKVAGTLSWAARDDGGGTARYRLEFAAPREGTAVQVPYAPFNLRHFDAEGRATPPATFARMQILPQRPIGGRVRFRDGRGPVGTYHVGPTADEAAPGAALRRPFLYPVFGPDGDELTGFGKPHDPTGSHDHHNSVWVAHASVDGIDFWSDKGGLIVHEALEAAGDGPVFARLVQRTRWVHAGAVRLRERRTLTVHRTPGEFRAIDVGLEWSSPGGEPVVLGKTTFGPLAVRVAPGMSVFDGGGTIRTAAGPLNEQRVHLTKSEWLDQSGPVADGRLAGVAVLDHPSNPNFPTTWHCRNDGWAGVALNAGGALSVAPGVPLVLRYRLVLHRGDADAGRVSLRRAEFAARPVVRFGPAAPRD